MIAPRFASSEACSRSDARLGRTLRRRIEYGNMLNVRMPPSSRDPGFSDRRGRCAPRLPGRVYLPSAIWRTGHMRMTARTGWNTSWHKGTYPLLGSCAGSRSDWSILGASILGASILGASVLGVQATWPLRARRHRRLGPRAALAVLRPQPRPDLICLYEEKVLPRRLGRRQRGGRLAAQELGPPGTSHYLARREREGGLVLRAAPSATSSAVPSATSSAVPSAAPL